MHEEALVRRLRAKIDALSEAQGRAPIVRATVLLGPLSHLDEPRLRALWARAMAGSAAEHAELTVEASASWDAPSADALVLRTVTFAEPERAADPPPAVSAKGPP
ncbi:MAG TPA: hypothetical protein VMH49_02385 [Thermoplasmata archaeon]|nr:hypothetical protein [Thermoplasmata archaeon]